MSDKKQDNTDEITEEQIINARKNLGELYANLILQDDGTINNDCRQAVETMIALVHGLVPLFDPDVWEMITQDIIAIQDGIKAAYGMFGNDGKPLPAEQLHAKLLKVNQDVADELQRMMDKQKRLYK